jgi:REP element-mobilizing transposase RayT
MLETHRRSPNFHPDPAYLFLTLRLFGSLPAIQGDGSSQTSGHPVWLQDGRIARLVGETIQWGETRKRWYNLDAWVVMPDHLHMLLLPQVPVPAITRWLKSWTAQQANEALGRVGEPFWQEESSDHWARNPQERGQIARYIEQDPVSAGLVTSAKQWKWSSASKPAAAERQTAPPSELAGLKLSGTSSGMRYRAEW